MTRLRSLPLSRSAILAALGALSALGYGGAVGLRALSQPGDVWSFVALFGGLFALYFGAVYVARRCPPQAAKAVLWQVFAWAVLFRLCLLPAGLVPESMVHDLKADLRSEAVGYRNFLLYDNDVWRYLWDGHVFAAGIDPYRYSPLELEERADEEEPVAQALFEEELWQDVFDNVSYTGYRTVYPPLAQVLFGLLHVLAPGSVFVFKLVLVGFDLATCALLALILKQLSAGSAHVGPTDCIIYAWNPLVLKEFAGSGHVDAMMIFLLVLALHLLLAGHRRSSLGVLALSILTKLTSVLLVGLFLRRVAVRHWPLLPLVVALGYLPFVQSLNHMLQGLAAFSREWVFNPGPWALVEWGFQKLGASGRQGADLVAAFLVLAVLVYATLKDDGRSQSLMRLGFLVLATFLVVGATVMPWYLLWALPFAAATGNRAWLALTALSLLSYLIYIDQIQHPWWLWTEYGVFFALLGWEVWRKKTGSARTGA